MNEPKRPAPWTDPPPGFHFEVYAPEEWVTPPIGAGRCRFGAGPKHRACGKPPVATLMRTIWVRDGNPRAPWDYCEEHLYGAWMEDGRVMRWRLVRDGEA